MFVETFLKCLFMTFLGPKTHLIPKFGAKLMRRQFDRLHGLVGVDDKKLFRVLYVDLSSRGGTLNPIKHLGEIDLV